jgi:hypothetical protein
MLLQQGEVKGRDFNRSVVEFTMLNQGTVLDARPPKISTAITSRGPRMPDPRPTKSPLQAIELLGVF